MDKILTGIYTRYNANAALKAAMPGGLHLELAPQSATMTYGVYSAVSGRPDYLLAGEYYEVVTIQFDIYAETNALRMAAYNALVALFDDSRPTATGYTSILMERVNQQMVRDGDLNEFYRAIITYECMYKKD